MLEVLRSGRLSLGPLLAEFEQGFARRVRAAHASAVSSGTAGLHLALRAAGVKRRRRGRHEPVLVRGQRERSRLRARPSGVRRHRPGHVQPRPRRRRGGGHRAHDGAAARAHLRLSGRSGRVRTARTADRRGRVRSAGRGRCRRCAGRWPRPCGGVRLLREQADHDRRGRHGHDGGRRGQGADRLRAKPGPRPGHGLARPRPARLQLPPVRDRLRARARPARPSRRAARRPRAGGRGSIARRWRRSRGWSFRARTRPPPTHGSAAAGSCTWSRFPATSTAIRSSGRCTGEGSRASRTSRRFT